MKGRIIVHFGSTYESARERVLDPITKLLMDENTVEVYNSKIVRKRLLDKGIKKYSIEEADEILRNKGISEIEIIPTFLIDGIEFGMIRSFIKKNEDSSVRYILRDSLMHDEESEDRLADVMSKIIEDLNKEKNPVLLCGHGSESSKNIRYVNLTKKIEDRLNIKVYPANMEGEHEYSNIIEKLLKNKINKVFVMPLMLVYGDHGFNDIEGDEESLKSELIKNDISYEIISKGIGEFEEVRELFMKDMPFKTDENNYIKNPMGIENKSMELIREELIRRHHVFSEDEFFITARIIHTTGDPDYIKYVSIDKDFINEALKSLKKGSKIYCDTNMIVSGINKKAMEKLGVEAITYISDEDVRKTAIEKSITRSMAGIDKAVEEGIKCFAFGNAPTALYRLLEHVKAKRVNPEFIIGIPVGFVGASESKEYLDTFDIPQIRVNGTRGGSNIVVSVINALLYKLGGRE